MELNGRRVALALAAALAALGTWFAIPRAAAETAPPTTTDAAAVTKTVLLVGDSVPQSLSDEFAAAAAKHGYAVVKATAGGCPAIGVQKAFSNGVPFKKKKFGCPSVVAEQDAKVEEFRPALVIWWSRFEVAPRLGPDGKLLAFGSKAYWRAQETSFAERARALTRLGARLVAVQIERPGHALAVRNPVEKYFLVGQTLLHRTDIVHTWNAFLARHKGPNVFSISIDGLVCRDAKTACDDRLPNGRPARPDGVHYSDTAARLLAPKVFEEAWRVAGMSDEAVR